MGGAKELRIKGGAKGLERRGRDKFEWEGITEWQERKHSPTPHW